MGLRNQCGSDINSAPFTVETGMEDPPGNEMQLMKGITVAGRFPVTLGQMRIMAGAARIADFGVPGRIAPVAVLEEEIDIIEIVIRSTINIKGVHDRLGVPRKDFHQISSL